MSRKINKSAIEMINSVIYALGNVHDKDVFLDDFMRTEAFLMEIASAGELARLTIDVMYADGLEKDGVRRKEL